VVDSHLSAVSEILAVIPIDDPAEPRRCARPACRGVPPVAARVLETMVESSARDESGPRNRLWHRLS
jgi:hypothetical protein